MTTVLTWNPLVVLTSESRDKGIELRLACRPTSESHDEDIDLGLVCWPYLEIIHAHRDLAKSRLDQWFTNTRVLKAVFLCD